MIANTEVYPSKTLSKNVTFSHLFLGRVLTREDLCFGIVAHDNNFNSSETDPASLHLRVFTSKSVSLLGWKAQPTETTAVHTANSYKTNVGPPFLWILSAQESLRMT